MLAESAEKGDKHEDAERDPIVNKDVSVVGAQVLDEESDGKVTHDAGYEDAGDEGGEIGGREPLLIYIEEFLGYRARNDGRGEEEGKARGGGAGHSAEESGGDGDAGSRDAGDQGKRLGEADGECVRERDVVEVSFVPADTF